MSYADELAKLSTNQLTSQNNSMFGGLTSMQNKPMETVDAGADPSGFNSQDMFGALQALGSLYGAYSGNKQLGLAEDQFKFSKGLASVNLSNQANLVNADLTDRQDLRNLDASRNAALGGSPSSTTSTADYLKQFGVKGSI